MKSLEFQLQSTDSLHEGHFNLMTTYQPNINILVKEDISINFNIFFSF